MQDSREACIPRQEKTANEGGCCKIKLRFKDKSRSFNRQKFLISWFSKKSKNPPFRAIGKERRIFVVIRFLFESEAFRSGSGCKRMEAG